MSHESFDASSRLNHLFSVLRWREYESLEDVDSVFDGFCELLEALTPDERELILELTEDFLWCPNCTYQTKLAKAADQIQSKDLGSGVDIFVVPMTDPNDAKYAKSGSNLAYMVKSRIRRIPAFSGRNVKCLSSASRLLTDFNLRSDATIIFVDDYLGSCATADAALDDYDELYRKSCDSVIALYLVAQRRGHEELKSRIASVFVAEIRDRGISDSVRIADKERARGLMRDIETRMNFDPEYHFGFRRCEGLECMIRPQDNTFPVFWQNDRRPGVVRIAPFPVE